MSIKHYGHEHPKKNVSVFCFHRDFENSIREYADYCYWDGKEWRYSINNMSLNGIVMEWRYDEEWYS